MVCCECTNGNNHFHKTEGHDQRAARIKKIIKLKADHPQRIEHQNKVHNWLLLHKGNGGKRADFKGTHSVKATVKQTSEFRATQMWGYLWQPSKWLPYFRAKRKDPNLALPKLSRFKVGDLVLEGVLMDPAEGWTSGIYNLDRMVSEGVELAIDAGDTADGLTEADVQANFENLARRHNVSTSAVFNADTGHVDNIEVEAEVDDADDAAAAGADCNDFLARYGALPVCSDPADGDDPDAQAGAAAGAQGGKTPKGGKPPKGGKTPKGGSPATGGGRRPTAHPQAPQAAKVSALKKPKLDKHGNMAEADRLAEYQTSVIVVTECEQLLTRLSQGASAINTIAAHATSLIEKVEFRIDPMYLDQYADDEATRTATLNKLRNLVMPLSSAADLMTCYHAKPGEWEHMSLNMRHALDSYYTHLQKYNPAYTVASVFPVTVVSRATESQFSRALAVANDQELPLTQALSECEPYLNDWVTLMRLEADSAPLSNPLLDPNQIGMRSLRGCFGLQISDIEAEQTRQMQKFVKLCIADPPKEQSPTKSRKRGSGGQAADAAEQALETGSVSPPTKSGKRASGGEPADAVEKAVESGSVAEETPSQFFDTREMQYFHLVTRKLRGIDVVGPAAVAVDKLACMLACRTVSNVEQVQESLEYFKNTSNMLAPEMRTQLGEKVKIKAWAVYAERSKDAALSENYQALESKLTRTVRQAPDEYIPALVTLAMEEKRVTVTLFAELVKEFKQIKRKSSGFPNPVADRIQVKMEAYSQVLKVWYISSYNERLKESLDSLGDGDTPLMNGGLERHLESVDLALHGVDISGVFICEEAVATFGKTRQVHIDTLKAVRAMCLKLRDHGGFQSPQVPLDSDITDYSTWSKTKIEKDKDSAEYSKETAAALCAFRDRVGQALALSVGSALAHAIGQEQAAIGAVEALSHANVIAKHDLYTILTGPKAQKILGTSQESLDAITTATTSVIQSKFISHGGGPESGIRVKLDLEDGPKTCTLSAAMLAGAVGSILLKVAHFHQQVGILNSGQSCVVRLNKTKALASSTCQDLQRLFESAAKTAQEVCTAQNIKSPMVVEKINLAAMQEKTTASVQTAILDMVRSSCTHIGEAVVDSLSGMTSFLSKVKKTTELGPETANELLVMITESGAAATAQFNKAFAAYEKAESLPGIINKIVTQKESGQQSKRHIFAGFAGDKVTETNLRTAAIINLCVVTLQAAFGPRRGQSLQTLLNIASELMKRDFSDSTADIPKVIHQAIQWTLNDLPKLGVRVGGTGCAPTRTPRNFSASRVRGSRG